MRVDVQHKDERFMRTYHEVEVVEITYDGQVEMTMSQSKEELETIRLETIHISFDE